MSHSERADEHLNRLDGHFAQQVASPADDVTQLLEGKADRLLVVVMLRPFNICRYRPNAIYRLFDYLHGNIGNRQH